MANFQRVSKDEVGITAAHANGDASTATMDPPGMTATPTTAGEEQLDGVLAAGQIILDLVFNTGQATKVEMRTACKDAGHATDVYQKGFARLYNQAKVLTEVTREDGSKAYELKRAAHAAKAAGLDVVAILQLQESASQPVKKREVFTGWYDVTGTLTVISPIMASRPVLGNPSARAFLRAMPKDNEEHILLSSGNYDAMFKETVKRAPDAPVIGNGIYHVFWDQQTLARKMLEKQLNPVPPSRPGQSGQGITEVEAVPVGTVIPFSARVPASHVHPEAFAVLLNLAGRYIGFSPSGAHKGWGRFIPKMDWKPEYAKFGVPRIDDDGNVDIDDAEIEAVREEGWNGD